MSPSSTATTATAVNCAQQQHQEEEYYSTHHAPPRSRCGVQFQVAGTGRRTFQNTESEPDRSVRPPSKNSADFSEALSVQVTYV
eukprot:3967588-Pyramimonas_sp.AAC.1